MLTSHGDDWPPMTIPVRSRCRCHCHDSFADVAHVAACCVPDPDWPTDGEDR